MGLSSRNAVRPRQAAPRKAKLHTPCCQIVRQSVQSVNFMKQTLSAEWLGDTSKHMQTPPTVDDMCQHDPINSFIKSLNYVQMMSDSPINIKQLKTSYELQTHTLFLCLQAWTGSAPRFVTLCCPCASVRLVLCDDFPLKGRVGGKVSNAKERRPIAGEDCLGETAL